MARLLHDYPEHNDGENHPVLATCWVVREVSNFQDTKWESPKEIPFETESMAGSFIETHRPDSGYSFQLVERHLKNDGRAHWVDVREIKL